MTLIDPEIEALAQHAPDVDLPIDAANRIAALALRITHIAQERSGIPTDPIHRRPFSERTSQERAANRMGVIRVVQALILLGWLELPTIQLPPAS